MFTLLVVELVRGIKQVVNKQDSVPKPKSRAIVPQQARVPVSHKGIETAFKFQRIRCTKCITTPDNHQKKETTPESRVPAWSSCHDMMSVFAKGAAKNGGF